MSVYLVRVEQGPGAFGAFVVRDPHGRPVTSSWSQTEATEAAAVLNRPQHTRHRRRGPRLPLWVHFAYALAKASAGSFILLTIYSY